jgi:predicted nucleic-acid-binding protein
VLGVDTNVLVRFFTKDDPVQFAQAQSLFAKAEDGIFVDPLVMAELNWVLRRVYKIPRPKVLAVLRGMTDSREFVLGKVDLVLAALSATSSTRCDFSDALIALLHEEAGCSKTATFDVRAQRLSQMISVEEALA